MQAQLTLFACAAMSFSSSVSPQRKKRSPAALGKQEREKNNAIIDAEFQLRRFPRVRSPQDSDNQFISLQVRRSVKSEEEMRSTTTSCDDFESTADFAKRAFRDSYSSSPACPCFSASLSIACCSARLRSMRNSTSKRDFQSFLCLEPVR